MTRKPLSVSMTVQEITLLLSENNDSTKALLLRMSHEVEHRDFVSMLFDLDDMQMRGDQILAAFNFCDGDSNKLRQYCCDRNSSMVAEVNRRVPNSRAYVSGIEARNPKLRVSERIRIEPTGFARGARVRK